MNSRFKSISLAFTISIFILSLIGFSVAHNQTFYSMTDSNVIPKILEAFKAMQEKIPGERVYLHLDKPFYKPGESIWFKAYLRNGSDLKASSTSDILHVEFIDPKGNIAKHIKIVGKKGLASGDFMLDENAAGGMYKIKAYTNWQKNEPNAAIFEKDIQVQNVVLPKLKMKLDFDRKAFGKGDNVSATVKLQTLENKPLANTSYKFLVNLGGTKFLESKGITSGEGEAFIKFDLPQELKSNDGLLNILIDYEGSTESISRSIPIVLNKIEFKLYPEGGDMVTGLQTKVAFKAINEFGKPADVEGYVKNSKGEKVCDFKSYHFGMGAFDIKPEKNEKYIACITKPQNITQTFDLPEPLERGYGLNVTEVSDSEIKLNVSSTEYEDLHLICAIRDQIVYSGTVKATYGINAVKISSANFPIGVARITLFDNRGIERAERLAFVNKNKQLKVKIETDKEKYQPREKVKMTVKVTDERGLPMPTNLSLSVVDDNLLTFADDRSGNILSKMLLEYDVKEKIEEASFYFDPKEEKANTAMDYLLMTSGWRRFTWKQILESELPQILYNPEKALVSGKVMDNTGKPMAKAKVEILGTNISTTSKEDGSFVIENFELYQPITVQVTLNGYNAQSQYLAEYNSNMYFSMYKYQPYNYYGSGTNKKSKVATRAGVKEDWPMAIELAEPAGVPMKAAEEKVPVVVIEKAPINNNVVVRKNQELIVNKIVPEPVMDAVIKDDRGDEDEIRIGFADKKKVIQGKPAVVGTGYYRARQFPSPAYSTDEKVEIRNDFRSTVYWNGNLETDRSGKAVVEFYNSDAITSFKAIAEGMSFDGSIGRAEQNFFTQLPFAMSVKAPVEVTTGDKIFFPLSLKNNTDKIISGNLTITLPDGLELVKQIGESQNINPKEVKLLQVECKVSDKIGKGNFIAKFQSEGFDDAFSQEINISPRGFPASMAFSGNEMEKEYHVNISNIVPGSMDASFTAYPSVVNDMMKGVESIVREPYGCFEQTSSSNYPNIMVKQYLMEIQKGQGAQSKSAQDFGIKSDIDAMLDRGYKRLVSYETKEKGYEWFGGSPGHEALTAYGLVQFNDMKKVYNGVDEGMMQRTADWLLSRRNGKGGYERNARALDNFGRANEDVTNAYITYALSEAGFKKIDNEANSAYDKAITSKDPYQLALVASTMYNLGDVSRGDKALNTLEKLQNDNGSWKGLIHSITHSQGVSLDVETTSLSVLAMLKSKNPNGRVMGKAIEFITSSRNAYGSFGSTQGTVLALKAITQYAKFSKRTAEDGTIEIFIDGHKVGSRDFKAGESRAIEINEFEKYLDEGKHKIKVKYSGAKEALPYSFAIKYNTFLPPSSKDCKVTLKTDILNSTVKVGETSRLKATLINNTQEGLPMTMAIIGIPAGLTAQPWQLKEMQEKGLVDFYEVRGNNVFFYYRQMKPGETKEINLDLKAEMPGEFEAGASSGYLYYNSEYKSWSKPEKIKIVK